MQINVITQSVGVEETLGSCTAEQPIDADITLPDYCPDIRRVLKCLVTPRITAVQTAGDRATADGSAGVCVIYTDEQGTVCCFEQTYPFSKYADLKGADENCCVNVRAYTQYANCRAVSPRRLDIHAVVSVAFGISGVKEEEIITGAEGAGIQLRCCDSRTASLVACTETAFPMSETVPLPDGDPAVSCVLSAQAAALAQEIKVISNKLLVKGELTVSAVCRGEGGEERADDAGRDGRAQGGGVKVAVFSVREERDARRGQEVEKVDGLRRALLHAEKERHAQGLSRAELPDRHRCLFRLLRP